MILRAKILLLWLLVLVIPAQGFAAVLQSACMPVVAEIAVATPHNMHSMQHADQHNQGHHAMAMTAPGAVQDHAQHLSHKAGSSCSSCATCNVGAVLPLALATPAMPDLPSHRYLSLPASGFVGFTPENPDRPPAFA